MIAIRRSARVQLADLPQLRRQEQCDRLRPEAENDYVDLDLPSGSGVALPTVI